jgi:hypothetical protein
MAPKRADASGVPPDSSSIAGGTLGNTLVLTGLFIMRRTYCARTASRARAVALTIAMCCAFAWSNKRFAAFFSLTCSGVNPAGNAAFSVLPEKCQSCISRCMDNSHQLR